MQLINIVLFWVFFGFLTSFIAKKKDRHPLLWFMIGLFLGIFGVLLALFLPKRVATAPSAPKALTPIRPTKSDAWIKLWYYLDHTHQQQGPLEFPDLIKNWKLQTISEKSYVWGEGMPEWKRLIDLPDLIKEIEQN